MEAGVTTELGQHRIAGKSLSLNSPRVLCVRCASAVNVFRTFLNRGVAEHAEFTQRKTTLTHYHSAESIRICNANC